MSIWASFHRLLVLKLVRKREKLFFSKVSTFSLFSPVLQRWVHKSKTETLSRGGGVGGLLSPSQACFSRSAALILLRHSGMELEGRKTGSQPAPRDQPPDKGTEQQECTQRGHQSAKLAEVSSEGRWGRLVAQRSSICLRPRAWSWSPGIESHVRLPAWSLLLPLPVSLPLCLCVCLL